MNIDLIPERRTALSIAAAVACGLGTFVPLIAPAAPAQAAPYCDPAVSGGPNGDTIPGTRYVDNMCGRRGADTLTGRGGGDWIYGGPGGDTLDGQGGWDSIYAGDGDDYVEGRAGVDWIAGGGGYDRLGGGFGDDTLTPGAGGSLVWGDNGSDTIHAENGSYDEIDCGGGTLDEAWVDDGWDDVMNCEITH